MNKPSIYDYTDYRRYLKDWLEASAGRPSLRGFAKKVGCAPSMISSVIAGTRDLRPPLLDRAVDALGLESHERAYFLDLVEFEVAPTLALRRQVLDRIMSTRRFRSARRIVDAMYLVFSRWYYGAIIELARCEGFREDPSWIAQTLVPAISEPEAAEALETLIAAGFLVRREDGRLQAEDVLWATDQEVGRVYGPGLAVHHRWILARGPEAIDEFEREERHFGTLSFALSDDAFADLKAAVRRFEQEVMSRFNERTPRTRVYQMSMQLYPLSKVTR